MTLLILAFAGGVLTIVSPCILPVLPFVLARANGSFLKNGLPLLLGMVLAFTAVATLAAVGGSWAVDANEYGRWIAMGLLAFFALTLLFPALAEWASRPLVAWGARLSESADKGGVDRGSFWPSLLLGGATGLLWAPCAGPILGLILTSAALKGANAGTSLLLLAYACGAATSLALALWFGGRVRTLLRRSLGISQWARRGMGVAVLAGVAIIATGLDTGLLNGLSLDRTSGIEDALIEGLAPQQRGGERDVGIDEPDNEGNPMVIKTSFVPPVSSRSKSNVAPLDGAVEWLNSPPLTTESLRGKVVLIDFWTYSCINCIRTLPYIRAWADKYKDAGLVVIGVHTPEFAFEKKSANVRKALKDLDIRYPVAVDSNYSIWRAFGNQYWPALYFVDAQGRVRHHVFGEGEYDESERVIQTLLKENGQAMPGGDLVSVHGTGAQAEAGRGAMSDETYIGYGQASNFVSADRVAVDRPHTYAPASKLSLNDWTLGGDWTIQREFAVSDRAGASIAYRFRARDLHLVMGRVEGGQPVRFRVLVDGKPPLEGHGTDIDAQGNGVIDAYRLYQLVRLPSAGEHVFEIQFLDAGAEPYVFTFG